MNNSYEVALVIAEDEWKKIPEEYQQLFSQATRDEHIDCKEHKALYFRLQNACWDEFENKDIPKFYEFLREFVDAEQCLLLVVDGNFEENESLDYGFFMDNPWDLHKATTISLEDNRE
jgi:TRAP-type mannitol/chloroaromatic compound transport system substrate-binding protein